jgi:hypothetical protein
MKLTLGWKYSLTAVCLAILTITSQAPAFSDTYHTADFSGGISMGSANVKAPFLHNGFEPGGPVSGSFVFDDQLIPAPGSGFVNVFFATFPDIGNIPAATAFTIKLGELPPLTFTLADAMDGSGAIQYKNGHFNGFFFQTDFTFMGNQYQFVDQGGTWNIHAPGSFSNLVSGYINIGDNNLTNMQPYVPAVPVPGTLLLFGSGMAALIGFRQE